MNQTQTQTSHLSGKKKLKLLMLLPTKSLNSAKKYKCKRKKIKRNPRLGWVRLIYIYIYMSLFLYHNKNQTKFTHNLCNFSKTTISKITKEKKKEEVVIYVCHGMGMKNETSWGNYYFYSSATTLISPFSRRS